MAAELKVSRSTISNAFNRPDQLSAELRERVLATAKRMGYPGLIRWPARCGLEKRAPSVW
ncbi:bacterial regulatory s, lacI family protein [Mycobacterium ulcerans str. Harvey]|uniref:Bacterial regulatory s, lacI family protein n=1 Tax=Mycobacterium ulcerans str. Harvey TaxID=1299332 RepID=A0ABP3AB19_MYCUL|nr:bacterial regulatory s, lacI family protein [Mycobacterium ulcerans str. Harvey]